MKIQLSHKLNAEFCEDGTLKFSKNIDKLDFIELDALAVFLKSLIFKIQEE